MDFTITPHQHLTTLDELYYRGDKEVPFLNNYAVADFRGLWLDFEAGFAGHGTDQRSFILTDVGRRNKPMDENQKLLTDCEFSTANRRVLTARTIDEEKSRQHKAARCSVENTFHDYKILRTVKKESRHSAAIQGIYVEAYTRLYNHL